MSVALSRFRRGWVSVSNASTTGESASRGGLAHARHVERTLRWTVGRRELRYAGRRQPDVIGRLGVPRRVVAAYLDVPAIPDGHALNVDPRGAVGQQADAAHAARLVVPAADLAPREEAASVVGPVAALPAVAVALAQCMPDAVGDERAFDENLAVGARREISAPSILGRRDADGGSLGELRPVLGRRSLHLLFPEPPAAHPGKPARVGEIRRYGCRCLRACSLRRRRQRQSQ